MCLPLGCRLTGAYNCGSGLEVPRDGSPSRMKGYTFGARERTVDAKSTVGVRCHGPLASQVGMGIHPSARPWLSCRRLQTQSCPDENYVHQSMPSCWQVNMLVIAIVLPSMQMDTRAWL